LGGDRAAAKLALEFMQVKGGWQKLFAGELGLSEEKPEGKAENVLPALLIFIRKASPENRVARNLRL